MLELKVVQFLPKVAQNVSKADLRKIDLFQNSPKASPQFWLLLWEN